MIDMADTIRRLVLNMARFSGISHLGKPLLGGMGAILMLHRTTTQPVDPDDGNRHLRVTPEFLGRLLGDIRKAGYAFVSMDEVCDRLSGSGSGEGRFVALTADDGYRDNLVEALPVLETHQAPMTIYVAPGLVDGDVDLWWEVVEELIRATDRLSVPVKGRSLTLDCSTPSGRSASRKRLHDILQNELTEEEQRDFLRPLALSVGIDPVRQSRMALLNWEELRRASQHPLISIGAHSVHHYSLRRLDEEKALGEMLRSADIIERQTGERPKHLAYPYGFPAAVGQREAALAKRAGFRTAVTTRHGLIQQGHASHLHALPRLSVNGRYQQLGYMRTMLSGISTPLANKGKVLVTV